MKRREQRATWFKCFLSSKATIDAIPDENVGKGLKAAFAYFENKTIPELDPLSNVVFCAMRPYIDEAYGVPSSFISHIGYARKDKLLFVRMKPSSRVYIYFKVPYSVCSGFVRAESIGSFYNDNIKDAFRGTLFGFVFDKSN